MKSFLLLLIIFFSYLLTIYSFNKNDINLIPSLGYGTAGLGQPNQSIPLIKEALKLGILLIDTAQAREWYDEDAVGKAIDEAIAEGIISGRNIDDNINDDNLNYSRDNVLNKLTVVTKVHPRSFEYNKMKAMIEKSLKNFKNVKNLFILLHSASCWQGHCTDEELKYTWRDGWKSLEKIKEEYHNSIQGIGVSNFDYNLLDHLIKYESNTKVSIIQNWNDFYHQDIDVQKLANDHNIQYMSYSSFGSQWKYIINNNNKNHFIPIENNYILKNLSKKYNSSINDLIISYQITNGLIIIPKTSNYQHLKDNFQYCQGGKEDIITPCNTYFYLNNKETFNKYYNQNNLDKKLIQFDNEDLEILSKLDGIYNYYL